MKTSTFVIVIIIILILLGGGWYYYSMQPAATTPIDTTTETATPTGSETGSTTSTTSTGSDTGMPDNGVTVGVDTTATVTSTPMTATVHLTANGFSPATVTVAKGGTVTFINDTSSDMWVASDIHPTHTEYDGTTRATHCAPGYTGAKPFDECGTGNQYSFTFTKEGSVEYHNHDNASRTGLVVVK